jgi:NAD(P)-dependent dehydrogenase (short-subunit alcohol dehydrogenase family)
MSLRRNRVESLENKVALVTGGASGIGQATVRRLAALGASVAVVDIDTARAEVAAAEVGGIAIGADVSRSDDWTRIVSSIREQLGGLDVAHLNAGVTTGVADITELTDEEYRRIVGVNMDGVTFGVRAVLPELRSRGGGAIVATASLAGIVAFPLDAAYTMTKHAVVGLVRALGRVLGAEGITINAVCPGLVDTPLLSGPIRDALVESGFPLIDPDSVADAVLECVLGDVTGQAFVVQAGLEPTPYRFGRPPGPREPGAVGKLPPAWIADPGVSGKKES